MTCPRCGQPTPYGNLTATERRFVETLDAARPRTVMTAELIEAVWGDSPPAKPKPRLARLAWAVREKGVAVLGRTHHGYWRES